MRKLNQKRYETHSYLKRVFAWENSTKNMRKRRYHDHNDSFWVRKLIQKRHLEGAEQNQVLGPTNLGSVLFASDTRTLKCRVFMNGIWRVYWTVPLAWESHSFIHGYVCRIESLLQEKVSDSRNPVWLLKDGSHKILAVVALVSDVRMTQRDRARGAGDGRQCFTPVNHWKLTDLVALSSILYRFRRLRRLNP